VIFAVWRRPRRLIARFSPAQRWVLLGLGVVLAAMNSLFYLAVDRLPLSTVCAIEFLGTVILRGWRPDPRHLLVLAISGDAALTDVRLVGETLGFVFAFANCIGFMLYVVLGHRIANTAADGTPSSSDAGAPAGSGVMSGIDQLVAAMLVVAAVVATRSASEARRRHS
jgi:inner membrane transporter RhtA